MRAFGGAAVLAWALAVLPASAAETALLKMDAATQSRLGVTTQPLAAGRREASISGFARALDPGPLAQLDSDIAAAAAALAASQAEAARTRSLNAAEQTVSKQAAEAAASQARQDAAKLLLLHRRVGLEWGPSLSRFSDARRSKLVADIAAGRAALVRIDAAQGLSQGRGFAEIDLGAGGRVRAAILGPARAGDPRLQSTGVLALVSGAQAVQFGTGTVAPATIGAGGATDGVIIPRAALLRNAGQTFVYIRKDPGDFERRPVPAGLTDPGGIFVTTGFSAGEAVVTAGAAQLFAAQSARPAGKAD